MKIKIMNIFENYAPPDSGLKSGSGNAFYIESEKEKLLFDTGVGIFGTDGKKLLHNMTILGISPNDIDRIVLSHGHKDHTGGLPELLKGRTNTKPIQVIGHPAVREPKAAKLLFLRKLIGFPKLGEELEKKIEFKFVREPFKITKNLSTTGEILERPEKDGTQSRLLHKENGKWKRDPLLDDLSLVLETKKGLVLLCGCCHAGLLNTCAHISKIFNKRIEAIIGGTHMGAFSEEEVKHVANILEKNYDTPRLYLNHCTGKKAIEQLKERFGPEIVRPCHVGTELIFEC